MLWEKKLKIQIRYFNTVKAKIFYWIFFLNSAISAGFTHEHTAEKSETTEAHGEKSAAESLTVSLERIVVPVIQKNRLLGYVLLNIVLKMANPEDKSAIEQHKSRILDLIYTDLYRVFAIFWLEKSKIEPEWVKRRIKKIIAEKFFLKTNTEVELQNLSFSPPRETVLTFK